jgi:hypothetical protein
MPAVHKAESQFLEGFQLAYDDRSGARLAFDSQPLTGGHGGHQRLQRKKAGELPEDSQAQELTPAAPATNLLRSCSFKQQLAPMQVEELCPARILCYVPKSYVRPGFAVPVVCS